MKAKEKLAGLLFDVVVEATAEAAKDLPAKKAATKASPRAMAVAEVINESDFGCKRSSVAKLMSAALGEVIVADDKAEMSEYDFKRFAAYVPTAAFNSHDYPVGKPAVCVRADYCLQEGGRLGNHLHGPKSSLRVATVAEIKRFFRNCPAEGLSKHIFG